MAKIIDDKDSFLIYRYIATDFKLVFPSLNTTKDMKPECIKSIIIKNDYINNIFPIIQLKMSCSAKLYYKIIKNKKDIKFYIRIQKFSLANSIYEKSLKTDYIKGNFNLILDDDDEDLYSSVRKKNNGDNQSDEDLKEQAQEVEFYLFNSKRMKSTRKIVNIIPEDCNVTNIIAYTASTAGIDNLLMTKSDNTTIYDEIRIPPMKAYKVIPYIDTMYGIHKTGSIIYFGLENSYIIKFDGKCTAWRKDEVKNTTIVIPEAGSSTTQQCCSLKKYNDNNYYLIGDYNDITFTDKSVTESTLNGDDIEVINNNDNSIDKTAKTGDTNRYIIENPGFNKFFKEIYIKQKKSLKKKIVVGFSDIDLSALQPNKKFNFSFEDTELNTKYNASYILVGLEIGLFRSTKNLHCTAKATFYYSSND
jgi:hypothetical protein